MYRSGFLAVLLLCVSLSAGAEQYYFKHFDTGDGLPSNTVLCMTEDSYGFMWFGTKDGACRYDGKRFSRIGPMGTVCAMCADREGHVWISTILGMWCMDLNTSSQEKIDIGVNRPVFEMQIDGDGFIWMVSAGNILRLDTKTHDVVRYPKETCFPAVKICVDDNGDVWFSSYDGCVKRYNRDSDDFTSLQVLSDNDIRAGKTLKFISGIDGERLLLATEQNDVLRVNHVSGEVEFLFRGNEDNVNALVMGMLVDSYDNYLVVTDRGLYIFNDSFEKYRYLTANPTDEFSLSNDNLRCISKDSAGRIWIGTFYSGLNLYNSSKVVFYRENSELPGTSIHGSTVRTIFRDGSGTIWVGTEDGYINRICSDRTVFKFDGLDRMPPKSNFHSIQLYNDKIYAASYDNGVFVFSAETGGFENRIDIDNGHCVVLLRTRSNRLVLGTTAGLYFFDDKKRRFEKDGDFNYFVHSLCQDDRGNLWIGTYGNGVFVRDVKTGKISTLSVSDDEHGMESAFVTNIFRDKSGDMWISTEGMGLCRVKADESQPGKYKLVYYTAEDGLPSNIVCAMAQVRDGKYWGSTDRGIFSLSVDATGKSSIHRYDCNFPVGNMFRYGAVLCTEDDRMYWGTTLGMMSFVPSDFDSPGTPELYISDILVGHQDKEESIASRQGLSTLVSNVFKVKYKDASYITIRFAVPQDDNLREQRFHYRLRQGGKNVIESFTKENHITFAGINPGHYIFEVMLAGCESEDSQKRVEIIVSPPFYASNEAKLLATVLCCVIAVCLVLKYRKKRKAAQEKMIADLENEKQKEIYDAKINFFTNITHDIRTPLTLIKMPLDKILDTGEYTADSLEDLKTIQSNTDRLLSLTNQLMDFRKMESHRLRLNFIDEDICEIVRKCCADFRGAAADNGIDFRADIPEHEVKIKCVAASVEKIVCNLISNGLKYCHSSVNLSLDEGENSITIRVTSDGKKVSAEDRENIFKPFFQEKSRKVKIVGSRGTGLGLSFSRTLAELCQGSLSLLDNPQVPDSNTFVLVLPKDQTDQVELVEPDTDIISESDSAMKFMESRRTILVVEDDPVLARYIGKVLSEEYNVSIAGNGQEALDIIAKERVDMVVSDIMMPVMDGCTLCNQIKTNIEYSHIPVILLTAAIGMDKHMETLKVGADGYLEKPFGVELLKASIENLFKNRELMFRQFADSPLSHFNGLKVNNIDDEFMDRLHDEIMDRLSETDLNVESLAAKLGASRSTLFRKVKGNTGLNINEYICLCRLKKGAELLAEGKYRINEVAYLVGFTSPSYFAGKFKQQFNISPSEFLKNIKK